MEEKVMSQGRKPVRVVARVRGVEDPEMESSVDGSSTRSVSVQKTRGDESETVSISFGDQSARPKYSYKLDYCYEEKDDMGLIFTKEIKPLISVVFAGRDATVIAYGARGSGKTYLVQGTDMEPGLAMLAIAEILNMAEERENSISVSLYEVYQENVYDLFDPEKPMVSVLEDAQGKVQLKGLSKLPVKSLPEFQNLYFRGNKLRNSLEKVTSEPPHRSHKGLMIHVSPCHANSGSQVRMNFLDLAGYEDPRRQNNNGQASLEITRINKSVYALQNVMYALNANEFHVPYRESKLSRMLKDSLQGPNRTLLITCLRPTFCQDSVCMLSLASRICQGSDRAMTNSTKKISSYAKPIVLSSQRKRLPLSVSATARKQTGTRGDLTGRRTKVNAVASAIKGRKLFGEASDCIKSKKNSKKEISSSEVISNVQSSTLEEEVSSSAIFPDGQSSSLEEESSTSAFSGSVITAEVEYSMLASFSSEAANAVDKDMPLKDEKEVEGAGPCFDDAIAEDLSLVDKERENNSSPNQEDLASPDECEKLDKENDGSLANKAASPPLSVRLQELSDALKFIYNSSNPPCIEVPEKNHPPLTASQTEVSENSDTTSDLVVNVEARTPERSLNSNFSCSPWKTLSAHSSKVKNSVVDEYLKFLNTAEKDDLKKLKGIGEKRATYILGLREESPEPFKSLDDLKEIGLSERQIKGMLKKEVGEIFN